MLGRWASTSTACELLNSLLKVVSAVCFHVSYSRGKSLANFEFSDTIPYIGVFLLLKMLTTSALRSKSDDTRRPRMKTTTIEPPNNSHPCQRFNCFAISISYLFLVSVFIMFLLTRLGVVHECVWVTCLSFQACLATSLAQATWVMALLHWA